MKSFRVYTEAKLSTSEKLNRNLKKGGFDADASLARIEAIRKKYAQPQTSEPKKEVKEDYHEIEKQLGPKATELQDREEVKRQKEHLTKKAKDNYELSKREGGGGAAAAKAVSYEKARDSIHSEEVEPIKEGMSARFRLAAALQREKQNRENKEAARKAREETAKQNKQSVKEDAGAMAAAPTNSVAGVAGSGDSRLPAGQREPGVSKKRNPVLKGMFTRKPPKM